MPQDYETIGQTAHLIGYSVSRLYTLRSNRKHRKPDYLSGLRSFTVSSKIYFNRDEVENWVSTQAAARYRRLNQPACSPVPPV